MRFYSSKRQNHNISFSFHALTCLALGSFTLGTGFRIESVPATYEVPSVNTSVQAHLRDDENGLVELELLRQQLAATTRQLYNYQTQLFRASHPNDLAKIAELGQALADKEKLNSQLVEALRSLEKEILVTRKKNATLEVAADALTSMLDTHRISAEKEANELREYLDILKGSFELEKQALLTKTKLYEADQLKQSHQEATKLKQLLSEQQASLDIVEQRMRIAEVALADEQVKNNVLDTKIYDFSQLLEAKDRALQEAIAETAKAKELFLELQANNDQLSRDFQNMQKNAQDTEIVGR